MHSPSFPSPDPSTFLRFFDTFIKYRSMYYVCGNIVKPLTEPFRMSFVELLGPVMMEWFVSHYWGMQVRHFVHAICKHAQSDQLAWREPAYWICTFSNSQWHIAEELGNGRWQDSSFYLALSQPPLQGYYHDHWRACWTFKPDLVSFWSVSDNGFLTYWMNFKFSFSKKFYRTLFSWRS